MFRTGTPRVLLRSLRATASRPASHAASKPPSASSLSTLGASRIQQAGQLKRATAALLQRAQATTLARPPPGLDSIDRAAEKKWGQEKLKPRPELVSTASSTRPIFSEVGVREPEREPDMAAGIMADLATIKSTFDLTEVPRQAYAIGLAGVLPYLATSAGTLYCAWEISHVHRAGTGLLMGEETAGALLHFLEPLQVGYGAVIISFLGAIHWGLEWAGFGGHQGYPRYAIGVVAPAVAWPTMLLPAEYALIGQFAAFNLLYYVDARATRRGWAPMWYGTYRFVLTFVVGASIVASLIGRGHIPEQVGRLPSPVERLRTLKANAAAELVKEEALRAKALAGKAEAAPRGHEASGESDEE